ncbi:MAG: hypothetical protein ACTIKC_02050 [Psychrobacter sp.]
MTPEEILESFRKNGWVMLPDDFMQNTIDTLHHNIHSIKLMAEIEVLRGGYLDENIALLQKNLSDIAFTLEKVMYDQQ